MVDDLTADAFAGVIFSDVDFAALVLAATGFFAVLGADFSGATALDGATFADDFAVGFTPVTLVVLARVDTVFTLVFCDTDLDVRAPVGGADFFAAGVAIVLKHRPNQFH